MDAAVIWAHLFNLSHGLASCLASAACFYLAGLAILPNRWKLARGEFSAVLGAALFAVVCWFGVGRGVRLPLLASGFVGGALVLAGLRYRWLGEAIRPLLTRTTLGWVFAYSLLYALSYLFTLPPVTPEHLPPAWTGNIDLLTYISHTRYVVHPVDSVRADYLDYIYFQTPGVFYFLGWLSLFFDQAPIRAAMPAQFGLAALSGLFAARTSRDVFSLSRGAALAVGCILVSGPFFRYVAGAYFVSTLMSTPLVLFLLWTTVSCRPQRVLDVGLAVRFASVYLLLLLIYPFQLMVGLGLQLGTIVLLLIAELQTGSLGSQRNLWRERARAAASRAVRTVCAALVPLTLLGLGFRQHVAWSADMIWRLSEKNFNGWPMDLLSPMALLGVPGGTITESGVQIQNPDERLWAMAVFGVIGVCLIGLFYGTYYKRTMPAARGLAGLAGASFIAYLAYYWHIGASYQQWKFASYSALPLSFVVFAGGLYLFHQSSVFARLTGGATGRWLTAAVSILVAVSLIGGNLLVHAFNDPPLKQLSGTRRNIEQLDGLSSFNEISIWSESHGLDTWFLRYFLPSKRVNFVGGGRFDYSVFEKISSEQPLLFLDGCQSVGHDEVIAVPGVGCLLLAPPTPLLEEEYDFNRSLVFLDAQGLAGAEDNGQWNESSTVTLTLTVDPGRTQLDRRLYINLYVHPFLPPGVRAQQRLLMSWGVGHEAEAALRGDPWNEWLSLPVESDDWSETWVMPIEIRLPDAVGGVWEGPPDAQRWVDRPDYPQLAVMFQKLVISAEPKGRVLESR